MFVYVYLISNISINKSEGLLLVAECEKALQKQYQFNLVKQ